MKRILPHRGTRKRSKLWRLAMGCGVALILQGCADADVPGARNVNIPSPKAATDKEDAVNEGAEPVMYLPLGRDVLLPLGASTDSLPTENVGPFELRGETLAGALQLILADYDVSLAFESDLGLSRTVTVANLRGPLNKVVEQVCSLADLYCAYENDILTVKETQTFTVKVPPISGDDGFLSNIASGLAAIIGSAPVVDPSTRTIIYKASARTADMAERYFQRMRASTALIVFETYIWEVTLNSDNAAGIDWDQFPAIGKFNTGIEIAGTSVVKAIAGNAVSIGLPTTADTAAGIPANRILQFISRFGTTKTVSQPRITVLSGSEAKFRAATENTFVSEFTQTIDQGQNTVAVSTSTIDSGLEVTIGSAWDNATVYANVAIHLSDADVGEQIPFGSSTDNSFIQLPSSTERELSTQVRMRPGDSVLIAGLVEQEDDYNKEGLGWAKPLIPTSRQASTRNSELVFMLRPRVVVYTSPDEAQSFTEVRGAANRGVAPFNYDFSPFKTGATNGGMAVDLIANRPPEALDPSMKSSAPAMSAPTPAPYHAPAPQPSYAPVSSAPPADSAYPPSAPPPGAAWNSPVSLTPLPPASLDPSEDKNQ